MRTIPPPGSRPSFYLLLLSNIFVSDIEMKCSSSAYSHISKSIIIMTLLARWTYPRQLIILLSVKRLLISGWMVTKQVNIIRLQRRSQGETQLPSYDTETKTDH